MAPYKIKKFEDYTEDEKRDLYNSELYKIATGQKGVDLSDYDKYRENRIICQMPTSGHFSGYDNSRFVCTGSGMGFFSHWNH